jgi:thioredoxin reductase (NADPH)
MTTESAIIVGAGPIGLACAISAKRRGLDPLVIDAGALCDSIVRYPVGMTFFTTPERLEIGGHPLTSCGAKATREEALKYYRGVARTEGLRLQTYTRFVGARRDGDHILCQVVTRHGSSERRCERLVLATGYFAHPKPLGVAGEELEHVSHYFDEAHRSFGLDVVVIGGRNSAVEAALELFRAGARVSLVYRGTTFPKGVKYWLRPDIENRIKAGEIQARMSAQVLRIDARGVHIRRSDGDEERLAADRVYALTGFRPDFDLFRKIGIELDERSGKPRLDPETLETNVAGVHMVGSTVSGLNTSDIFIENGRYDGEKVFGDAASRERARELYRHSVRYYGE